MMLPNSVFLQNPSVRRKSTGDRRAQLVHVFSETERGRQIDNLDEVALFSLLPVKAAR